MMQCAPLIQQPTDLVVHHCHGHDDDDDDGTIWTHRIL